MKIQLFSRHCLFSDASAHKKRLPHFNREDCYRNLLETTDPERVDITFFLDTAKGPRSSHFLKNETRYPVLEINAGTEAQSFLMMMAYVEKLDLPDETILYFLEDDYLHRHCWVDILHEGFQLNPDYVTLYDHRDKYHLPMYRNLTSKISFTQSCHWRTTPSTTNTFATRFGTLKKDLAIHRRFSLNRKITADHDKFLALQKRGATLISPLPGWSTHACEPNVIAPCFNWGQYFKEKPCKTH